MLELELMNYLLMSSLGYGAIVSLHNVFALNIDLVPTKVVLIDSVRYANSLPTSFSTYVTDYLGGKTNHDSSRLSQR